MVLTRLFWHASFKSKSMKNILLLSGLVLGFLHASAQTNYLWTWGSTLSSFYYNFDNYYTNNFQNPWPYTAFQPAPIISPGGAFVTLHAGGENSQSAGIRSDGSLWIWTRNGSLLLAPEPQQYGNDYNWKEVAFTTAARFAIKIDGSLWQLLQAGPVQIGTDTNWVSIEGADNHMLGLRSNGTIWRWTNSSNGTITRMPTQIGLASDWAKIDAVNQNSGGIKTDGSIWLWGDEQRDTLPVRIGTDNNWRTLSVVSGGLLAIKNDGSLWSMGETNLTGVLGTGNNNTSSQFVRIGAENTWLHIESSADAGYALKTDQSLWAWGSNSARQLGDSSNVNRLAPIRIGTSNDWIYVVGGNSHATGIRTFGFTTPTSSVEETKTKLVLQIYPNPASDFLWWQFEKEAEAKLQYSLFDSGGRKIQTGNMQGTMGKLEINDLPRGIYLLHFQSGPKLFKHRFIKI